MECHFTGPPPGWWSLTGTPGTGKSTVARSLPPDVLALELRDLANGRFGQVPARGPAEVDFRALGAWMRRHVPPNPVVLAGYLSHRLPVERAIVLRCHPIELAERLRSRTTSRRDLRENVQCEALDTLAGEARARTSQVWEFDTTHASPRAVAGRIRGLIEGRPTHSDPIDWLADPAVPTFLLHLAR